MPKKDNSTRVQQRSKFKQELETKPFNWTENQQKIIDCILDKHSKIVFINGRSGSGKSLITTFCGIQLIAQKKVSDYIFVRSPLECSDSAGMGYIKGDINQKFEPYVQVGREKFNELLTKDNVDKLFSDNRVHFQPINYIRGMTFNVKYIVAEEAGNLTFNEYKLLLTRYGEYSKMIIVGDMNQTDLTNGKRGAFKRIFDFFNNKESRSIGIHCFQLTREDVKRSSISNFVIDKLEEIEEKYKRV